jgi:hypothetical protein
LARYFSFRKLDKLFDRPRGHLQVLDSTAFKKMLHIGL